jgi:hypothetical protein
MKEKILNKINEGQEADVALYTWDIAPESLKDFWFKHLQIN